jgi:D-glycero-alpha-D-manno-heptose-7-phosphate kinase
MAFISKEIDNRMTLGNIQTVLKDHPIHTSAPCRIDFGGTLDISSFHFPLRHLTPTTVNLALDRRTTVTLQAGSDDRIRIGSEGIAEGVFPPAAAPYDHPLGLMFAVADYFGASGVRIDIRSSSPPKSGLGGSSVAAVALIAAFSKVEQIMGRRERSREGMVLLAHAIEQGVAGVPCGMQDQLAAAFGGVNAWIWPADPDQPPFMGKSLVEGEALDQLNRCLLVAYLGVSHVSKDVNSTWMQQFISGRHREAWKEIIALSRSFAEAIRALDVATAVEAMNRETAIRKVMTPQVLDGLGDGLAAAAVDCACGARFTGAGGGGCVWALGRPEDVAGLQPRWEKLLARRPTAGILDCRIDAHGVG